MRKLLFNIFKGCFLALLILIGLGVTSSWAAEFCLLADTTIMTMPDGNNVTMWGFSECTTDVNGILLTAGPVMVPGPMLTIPAGDSTLIIHLFNNLPDPISIVIPGQVANMLPVWRADGRVRSFTQETDPGNMLAMDYIWNNLKPGTYLYHSGTHVAVHMQMGLYGVMKHDAASGPPAEAYPGQAYDNDVVLVFSDIDPVMHTAVVDGQYGPGGTMTSTVSYTPTYFLINGEPFSYGRKPILAGSLDQVVLLRMINAGFRDMAPVLQGLNLTVIAQDGMPLTYPKTQYSVDLSGGRRIDALFTANKEGDFPIYDRGLALTNALKSPGGMLAYLEISSAFQNNLSIVNKGLLNGTGTVAVTSLPGGINCGTNCAQSYNPMTSLTLTATPGPNSVFKGWTGVDPATPPLSPTATITMDYDKVVTATFSGLRPIITLTAPNGGESWRRRSLQQIAWTYTGNPGLYARIELYKANKFYTVISYKTPMGANGTGSFNWRVPPAVKVGTDFKVKIVSLTNAAYFDLSNGSFGIAP